MLEKKQEVSIEKTDLCVIVCI